LIVADSSVLIEHLNDRDTPDVQMLRQLLSEGVPIACCDVSLLEVLQGARTDPHVQRLEEGLAPFGLLLTKSPQGFVAAASLYRTARRWGITIRSSLDCLIAAECIRVGAQLLHADADFERLSSVTALRLVTM